MNNRKILAGIAEAIGEPDKLTDITVAIDKLDKIGIEKVNEELSGKGYSQEAIEKLRPLLESRVQPRRNSPSLADCSKSSDLSGYRDLKR